MAVYNSLGTVCYGRNLMVIVYGRNYTVRLRRYLNTIWLWNLTSYDGPKLIMSSSGLDCPYHIYVTAVPYRILPYSIRPYTIRPYTIRPYTIRFFGRILRYGTVYGRILGEDMVQYGRNLKIRLWSIPMTNRAKSHPLWLENNYKLYYVFISIPL